MNSNDVIRFVAAYAFESTDASVSVRVFSDSDTSDKIYSDIN
jgi:hypothetical protein